MLNAALGRLAIWQKLAIFGVLGIAVSLPALVMYIAASSADVARVQREAAGLAPAQALLRVIQLTQQHRGLSAGVLGGNAAMASRREQVQAEVEQAMSQATAVFGGQIRDPATAETWKQATQHWKTLSGNVAQKSVTGAQSFAGHTALVTTYLVLVDRIADEFALSRDPDADTSVLINAVLIHLPNLTESLGQARGVGARLLAQQAASQDERAAVATLGGLSKLHLRNVSQALNEAGELNPRLRSALAGPLKDGVEAVEKALRLAEDEVIRPERLSFDGTEYFRAATVAIDAMFALNSTAATQLREIMLARKAAVRNFQYSMFGLIGLIALLAAATGYGITRAITRAMRDAVRLAQEVAAGNLRADVRVSGRDEIAQLMAALKEMNASLVNIIGQVRHGTDTIATASGQIAAGNQDLSQRTEEQAASLEETAASMEQLTGTVKQNADNARQANQLAQSSSQVAMKGGEVVGRVVETMTSINQSSRKIVDIISVIDGIAFQTNILALNAAVEAARAGEQGRGFAVVASEVRSLAQRSAAAAKEIKALIDDSMGRVDAGTQLVAQAGQTMDEIVGSIKRVTDIMGEIAAASDEQTRGIEQVNQAITQMDQVTQQNAALVEEASAAAQSMREQAGALVQAVSVFKLAEDQGAAFTRVAAVPGRAARAAGTRLAQEAVGKAREKLPPGAAENKAGPGPKLALAGGSAQGQLGTEF